MIPVRPCARGIDLLKIGRFWAGPERPTWLPEEVSDLTVETLRPELTAVRGVGQLYGYPNPFPGPPHTSADDVADAEVGAHALEVYRIPPNSSARPR